MYIVHYLLIYLFITESYTRYNKTQIKIKPNTNISKSASAYTHDKTRNVVRIEQVGTKVWVLLFRS